MLASRNGSLSGNALDAPVPSSRDSDHGSTRHGSSLADPATLTTRSSVVQALSELSQYSASLEQELVSLFEESEPVVEDAKRSISGLAPQLELIQEEASVLNSRLQGSASVAKRISERVRVLDEERKRIAMAAAWAVKVAELKSSLSLLANAVEQRDWDMATMHCRRALAIDPEIRGSKFAAAMVPTTDLPESPEVTLLELRKTMLKAFTDAFIHSTQERNEKEASRFFKLFPQVGWKKEGLDVYSSFARSMVREKGRMITEALGTGKAQSPTHYALLLTSLFEHLAMLIDQHQPVVDRHYGAGHFGHGVMPGIQDECDRLGNRILDSWREERAVRRKIDDVKAYRFSTPAASAAAVKSTSFIKASFNNPARTSSPALGHSTANSSFDEPAGPDGREVNQILSELAAISSRWGLYARFLSTRLQSATSDPTSSRRSLEEERAAQASEPLKDFRRVSVSERRHSTTSQGAVEAVLSGDDPESSTLPPQKDIASESQLGLRVSESMAQIYVPLETWYLRNSLEKAFRIDQPDLISKPYTSSILDDAFYVFRTVLARILSTSSLTVVSELVKMIKTVIEEEYIEVVVRKMENLWRTISGSMTVDGPRKEAASREMRTTYITYLNVLDVSSQYMNRVLLDVGNEQNMARLFGETDDLEQVLSMINSLTQLVSRFKSSLRTEIEHLFTQLTAARLRNVLYDALRDTSYILDDEAYTDAEARDLLRRRFVKGWEHLFSPFVSGAFTASNTDAYVSMGLDTILQPWENMILSPSSPTATIRFSELGALKFDKDLRNIIAFLTNQTQAPIRDKFTRLQQISYVLNLDDSENEQDLYQNAVSSGISWRLSMAEVRHVRSLRV